MEEKALKTRVGWPEEPHLRGVLVVGFKRSANTHGNARCIPVCWVWGDSKEDIEESCRSPEGSPEGSDFAAEEGYEEGGPNAEEGHEEVWDEVQEALSTMVHEDHDETVFAQGLKCRDPLHRHHPKRQCGLRMCLVYLYLLMSMCTTPSIR